MLSFARSSFIFKPTSKFLAFQSVLIEQMKYSRVISHNVQAWTTRFLACLRTLLRKCKLRDSSFRGAEFASQT